MELHGGDCGLWLVVSFYFLNVATLYGERASFEEKAFSFSLEDFAVGAHVRHFPRRILDLHCCSKRALGPLP